jgi:alkanesulfonate monooxygenase SsuD/methylene tetrahydromethanopterin reductase-like flavin-dependent oxidoreductase (luciferase family)
MTKDSGSQVFTSRQPTRERVGLIVDGNNAVTAVKTIVAAEAAGVRQIWMVQPPNWPDVLTTFAAAAIKTSIVRLGTSIVPTYPRHPLVLAQQALALYDIAPSRLRLGIGPSHRFIIEDMYGLQQRKPLTHLREYVEILRAALWEGKVNHHGYFYNVVATLPHTPQIPVLISTLGEKAFHLAGQIADGALSWVCPVPYLLSTGIPTLCTSAATAGRAAPPLVAHVLVALGEDRNSILLAGHRLLDFYAKIRFYANMFSNAGFQLTSDQTITDALVDNLVISGNEATVSARFTDLLVAGLDELMVSLVPTTSTVEEEQTRLMNLIGQL